MEGSSVGRIEPIRRAASDGWDRKGFALLVRQHGPAVHSYLARRAGPQVADDLFGEVWLQAWRSKGTFDPRRGPVLPWLLGVARNTLRAHFRLRADESHLVIEVPSDPWDQIDDRLDAARIGVALEDALSLLTAESREILLLVAWEGLSPTEVAQSLQMHPGTVRTRLHRARAALRDHLEARLGVSLDVDPQEVC